MQHYAATIGTFDGVHRGHAYMLDLLKREADSRGLHPLALTFDPHPLAFVRPEAAPLLLTDTARRISLINSHGVEAELLKFDDNMRRLTPEAFLGQLRDHGVKLLLMGYDNKFGHGGRDWDFDDYRAAGQLVGVEIVGAGQFAQTEPLPPISSSSIRSALAAGDIVAANSMLGRPFELSGEVVTGHRRGRTIGFPTANIAVDKKMLLPLNGVYLAQTEADGADYEALVNVGDRPTVNGRHITVEAYLKGFEGNLYGKTLTLKFLKFVRPEVKFESLEALKAQIHKDILVS